MSRTPIESPEDASGVRFREILAEVRRAKGEVGDLDEDEASPFSTHAFASASFSIDERPASLASGSAWDAALAWIEEQDEPATALDAPSSGADTAEAILGELGLNDALTADELNKARRLFMWANHPDRQGEAHRDIATRRVAIANMLVDRAQARLISGRRT
jgi:hypothetical protein